MIVALLKTKLQPGASVEEYGALGAQMYERVSNLAGFVSAEFFSGEDGQELTIARFESQEALAAWRTLPEHVQAQQRGYAEFYGSVSVEVCELIREHEWVRGPVMARLPG
jgi:heme-degrading monooxygenase HmoA